MALSEGYFEESDSESELEELEAAVRESKHVINVSRKDTESSVDMNEILIIESLLQKNEVLSKLYKQQEDVLIARLELCRSKLYAAKARVEDKRNTSNRIFKYSQYGAPYFKDAHGFACPVNSDVVKMKENDMLTCIDTSTKNWSTDDKKEFNEIMLAYLKSKAKEKVESQKRAVIRQQKTLLCRDEISKLTDKIEKLDIQCQIIESNSLSELAGSSIEEHDWERISATCSAQRTSGSVRAMWQQYLHPAINKSVWSRNEHQLLEELSVQHCQQNWEVVAAQLGTGRSAYLCFIYFKTSLHGPYTGRKWSKEEDENLKKLVASFKNGNYIPWGKIACYIKDRTKVQIYNRWHNHIKTDLRKGRFIPEEDAVLLASISQFGYDFSKVATLLPERSRAQLRSRYALLKSMNPEQWTLKEDRQLLQLVAQKKFSADDNIFSQVSQFFPGKSRVQIRLRYKTLERWSTLNPSLDLKFAPRRQSRNTEVTPEVDLKTALDNLSKVQCKSMTINENQQCLENEDDIDVDNLIVNYFIKKKSSISLVENADCPDSLNNDTKARMLKSILLLLQANLNADQLNKSYRINQQQRNMLSLFNNLTEITKDEKKRPPLVKTYSKKKPEEVPAIVANVESTIWCNTPIFRNQYCLPPNYSTILGLKMLLLQSSNPPHMKKAQFSYRAIAKNLEIKNHYDKWAKRFEMLFIWPLILSNVKPKFDSSIFETKDNEPVANRSINLNDSLTLSRSIVKSAIKRKNKTIQTRDTKQKKANVII